MPTGGDDGEKTVVKETNAFSPQAAKWSTDYAL
jgi:hypothetical protein